MGKSESSANDGERKETREEKSSKCVIEQRGEEGRLAD